MEGPSFNRYYLLKVWISVILLSPVVILMLLRFILLVNGGQGVLYMRGFLFSLILNGLLLSIPSLVLLYMLYGELVSKGIRPIALKWILVAAGISCLFITMYLIWGGIPHILNDNYYILLYPGSYTLCIILSGLGIPVLSK